MFKRVVVCLVVLLAVSLLWASPAPIQSLTEGKKAFPGFFDFYWDEASGKIWLEIDRFNQEFLYVHSLPAGLGSNDIGLDRNQIGGTHVVEFKRIGPKVLLVQPNYQFRALSADPAERQAVKDAFAVSVIWGFQVAGEAGGRVLVDATGFLMRDAHGVIRRLKDSREGNYRLDESRSAVYLPNTKNFPKNTEFEALLTLTGEATGRYVGRVTPDADAVTLRQHHSFIELPGPGYEPRIWDARSMFGGRGGYMDFATPIDQPLQKRFISRHRLKKKDPSAKISEPVEPIVYYIDRAAPEPIRTALLEGARWWNQAFEACGYKNAFRAEILPEGADPMDVRYNMVNWVHRSTRGWSYGGGVNDPRTGEIIKGHVVLGSQRVRQDFLIASGLVTEYSGDPDDTKIAVETALARIRQLSAHEIGHTLGVGHNYAANVNDRSSVMDYPHMRVKISPDGELDLSEAYGVGIGEWDKVYIEYGYQDFPEGVDEEKELRAILDRAFDSGLLYLTNQDAAPAGGAHPLSNDWVNGTDPVDELEHKMKVRAIALANFSEKKIRPGEPMAALEEVLVPVYMFHRFQIPAAASTIGGLNYNHTVRGGVQAPPRMIPAQDQSHALDVLLRTLDPVNLAIPDKLLAVLPPRAPGLGQTRELFDGHTGIVFDPLGAAEAVADLTVGSLLFPERAARLVQFHSRDPQLPGLEHVIDRLVAATWKAAAPGGFAGEIRRTVNVSVMRNLMGLAASEQAAPQVRAVAALKLDELKNWLKQNMPGISDPAHKAHVFFAVSQIELFQKDPAKVKLTPPLAAPPGAPIGG